MAAAEELFHAGAQLVVVALEAAAALVILLAAGRALLAFLSRAFHHLPPDEEERRRFARSLLLALDLTIGSDVLAVALRPTLDSVLVAGLVVLLRTVLTLVLEFELHRAGRRGEADAAPEASAPPGNVRHA